MINAIYPQMLKSDKSNRNVQTDMMPKAQSLDPRVRKAMETYVEQFKKKQASIEFRRDMKHNEQAANAINEHNRITGLLSNHILREQAPHGYVRSWNPFENKRRQAQYEREVQAFQRRQADRGRMEMRLDELKDFLNLD